MYGRGTPRRREKKGGSFKEILPHLKSNYKTLFYSFQWFVTLLFLLGCHSKSENYKQKFIDKPANLNLYHVTKVSDGDTFWCKDNREQRIKIRLIGIDAPEPRNYFRKKEQAFGREASQYVTDLLLHQTVKLEFDIDSLDQFGRTLAYVYLVDGTFVNEKIVKDGYAILMTITPNVKYEQYFINAQKYAREKKLGLWNSKD